MTAAPEFFNFTADVFDRWASQTPNQPALWWVDVDGRSETKLSFEELARQSVALAAGLRDAGLEPGNRVMLLIGRRPEWWVAMLALIRAGLVVAPGTTLLTGKDVAFRLEAAGVAAVIADAKTAEAVDVGRAGQPLKLLVSTGERPGWRSMASLMSPERRFPPTPTRSNDPCLLFFTSGTTGAPKMVLHTHVSYPLAHVVTGRDWLGVKAGDLHWNLSDTGWAKAAWSSLFGPWHQGATVFVQAPGPKFDAEQMLDTLAQYPITTLCAPPTAFRQLVTRNLTGRGLERIREVVAAGEPLNPEVIEQWRAATGRTIRDGYGQTETTLLLGNFPSQPVKPGSMGVPAPGFDISLVDENLSPVGANVEGEIAIRVKPARPLGLFAGYENNPEENERKFRGDFYLTGDRAVRDADGYYWFVGRADDVILSGGYRIGPFEVESALVEHPAVVEAAVVGAPDPERYQIVKAFVVVAPGIEPSVELSQQLKDHVKKTTAPYKYPREIEFVDVLPKTISGKILRGELRRREADKQAGG